MQQLSSLLPFLLLILLMYFFLIKPQKKREKQVNEMRNNIQVGDEIVTIGGICAKVVKTKDESLIIQVGADRTKFEIMRWAVSKVTNTTDKPSKKNTSNVVEEDEEKEAPKKSLPKRMKRLDSEVEADTIGIIPEAEPVQEAVSEAVEEPKTE